MCYWRYTILLLVGSLTALVYAGIDENLVFKHSFESYPPVITSSPPTSGEVDVPYFYDVEASDANGDVLVYLRCSGFLYQPEC